MLVWAADPVLYKSAAAESAAEETGSFDFTRWRKGERGWLGPPSSCFPCARAGSPYPPFSPKVGEGEQTYFMGTRRKMKNFSGKREKTQGRTSMHKTQRDGEGWMKTLDEGGGGESLREEPHALTVGGGGE